MWGAREVRKREEVVCAFARDTIKQHGRIDGLLRDFLSIPITPRLLFHRSDADAELYINRAPVGGRLCFASRLAGSVPKYLSWRISIGRSYLSAIMAEDIALIYLSPNS